MSKEKNSTPGILVCGTSRDRGGMSFASPSHLHQVTKVLPYQALFLPEHISEGWRREHSWGRGVGPW